ncbi:MAG: DUF4249 domain-containing protein [Cyclobacteriaceae bacterium]
MKITFRLTFAIIPLVLTQCLEPIDLETTAFDDLLVVEGLITDQSTRQQITLSRTIPLGLEDSSRRAEVGATVWVLSQDGNRIDFIEEEQGVYMTEELMSGKVGETFQLFIETANQRSYRSDVVTMVATPELDSIYAEFEQSPSSINSTAGLFHFYIDARNNPDQNQYYRWTWNSTFELTVPIPSRWLWVGGNDVIIRELGGENDHLQVQFCWNTEYSSQVLLRDLPAPLAGVIKFPITSFLSDSKRMHLGYSIEVKQYAVSKQSYEYWSSIAEITQEQGSLFDTQVGTITGNIRNVNEESEIVLGIFEAAQERSLRRQYHPLDFSSSGFRRREINYVNCDGTEPIVSTSEEIGETMERIGAGYVITFFTTGNPATAFYYPRRCSECTQYGDNQRPDFWE